jgi:predicted nucleotide-binding protein
MANVKIFVGSSLAAKNQAKLLIKDLQAATITFVPWWNAFMPARTLPEDLEAVAKKVDAAILVFSPDFRATVSGETVAIPNQNVVFEFGYLTGVLGRSKVAMACYGDFYLPSDLGGYIHISGSSFFKSSYAVPNSKKTKQDFQKWVSSI